MLDWILNLYSIFSTNQRVALFLGLALVLITYLTSGASHAGFVAIGSALVVLSGFAINIDKTWGAGIIVVVYLGYWVQPNWEWASNLLFALLNGMECGIEDMEKSGQLSHQSNMKECSSMLDPTNGND